MRHLPPLFMKHSPIPFAVTSYALTMSAWVSDRIFGPPNLSYADNLTLSWLWKHTIQAQIQIDQGQTYQACLWGDSISQGIYFGDRTVNFALGGLSSISLLEQLKFQQTADLQCTHAILAIGTNDAMYGTPDQVFLQNLKGAIALVRAMGAVRISLVAAFYATLPASQNSWLAGPNKRIKEINHLIQQVAYKEQVEFVIDELQPLFDEDTLHLNVTHDGVHLNPHGQNILRQVIVKLLESPPHSLAISVQNPLL
jgi:lysophospholipase L1-like esterase